MHLMNAALIVSLGIVLFCVLPWAFPFIRANSKRLMMAGTVVLLGFVAFDLIPETVEEGGYGALGLMVASWAFFSGLHVYSSKSHSHAGHGAGECESERRGHGLKSLVASMGIHCFAGGMMLVTSYEVSEAMAHAVLLSLVAHKGFEAIAVTSLLIERTHSRAQFLTSIALYALAFPAGVGVTLAIESALAGGLPHALVEQFAMSVTAVAIGSLFGCLVHDFLLPSVRELRRRPAPSTVTP